MEITPSEAKVKKIKDGDLVRVFNKRGEITLLAKINYSLLEGCLIIYNGWWISEGGGVNLLSAPRETDMGYGAAFHENRVNVEVVNKKN